MQRASLPCAVADRHVHSRERALEHVHGGLRLIAPVVQPGRIMVKGGIRLCPGCIFLRGRQAGVPRARDVRLGSESVDRGDMGFAAVSPGRYDDMQADMTGTLLPTSGAGCRSRQCDGRCLVPAALGRLCLEAGSMVRAVANRHGADGTQTRHGRSAWGAVSDVGRTVRMDARTAAGMAERDTEQRVQRDQCLPDEHRQGAEAPVPDGTSLPASVSAPPFCGSSDVQTFPVIGIHDQSDTCLPFHNGEELCGKTRHFCDKAFGKIQSDAVRLP